MDRGAQRRRQRVQPRAVQPLRLRAAGRGRLVLLPERLRRPTAQAAEAAPAADASDPANGGCGGAFPWSALAPGLAIAGEYTDSFAGAHQISTAFWKQGEGADASWHWLYAVDAEAGWMVAQNDANNPFSPGLFSRFDWTVGGDGTLYFCQSAFDAESAEAAAAAIRTL